MTTLLEWLAPIRVAFAGIKGSYQYAVGHAPEMNFEPSDIGPVLRIKNTRPATIIVNNVDASPPMLGFFHGDSVEDIARAVAAQRSTRRERPLLVLKPEQSESIVAMTFDPFGKSEPGQKINVTMHWRDAERGWFSESHVKRTVTVKDIRDIQQASERRRQRFIELN
jgi:hypothetical protein